MELAFRVLCLVSTWIAVFMLVGLLSTVYAQGAGRLNFEFFGKFASRFPQNAGIKAALAGTVWIVLLTGLIAIPIGIAAATYLEEFVKRKNRATELIELSIANLAGVPSIIYGILGLAVFVRFFALGRSVLAGSLTMSLLILPTIIVVSREALRAVPSSHRHGSLALGATRWQTVRRVVLPSATPGILTGIILSLSRAMGETAPLITIGAVSFINYVPNVRDQFTVLPMQVFDWSSRAQAGFHEAAAAGILVLLAVLVLMNSAAIVIRYRMSGRVHA